MAEAKAFYLQNPERFKLPESYALQTITHPAAEVAGRASSPAPPPVTPEVAKQMRARAEDALKQAKATKNYEQFGVLAEKISEDDYRVMMGDHRAVKAADLPAPILAVISKLQPGQVSDLIQVDGVLHDCAPQRPQPLADAEICRSERNLKSTDATEQGGEG